MTTYLGTAAIRGELITDAFCSKNCRGMAEPWEWITRDNDSYEFDETCATCGTLIPASTIWEEEIAGVTYLVAKIGNPQ